MPFRRFATKSACPSDVTASRAAAREVFRTENFYVPEPWVVLGSPHSPAFAESRFRALRGSSLTPSPDSLRNRVQPPATTAFYRRSPPSVPPTASCPATVEPTADVLPLQRTRFFAWARVTDCSAPKPAFLGVLCAHRDINPLRRFNSQLAPACSAGIPALPPLRPRRFSRPRRFRPQRALQVYFTPQPLPAFSQRGCSPDTAAPPRRWPLPSRLLTSPRCSQLPDCSTLRRPVLRAFIRAGICLSLASGVTPLRRAVPFGSSSSRFSLLARPYRL